MVSKSRNKIHQTWGPLISGALYMPPKKASAYLIVRGVDGLELVLVVLVVGAGRLRVHALPVHAAVAAARAVGVGDAIVEHKPE